MKINNTTIIFSNNSNEVNKQALIKLYDTCNKIFRNNEDVFYKSEQIEILKKDKSNVFI